MIALSSTNQSFSDEAMMALAAANAAIPSKEGSLRKDPLVPHYFQKPLDAEKNLIISQADASPHPMAYREAYLSQSTEAFSPIQAHQSL